MTFRRLSVYPQNAKKKGKQKKKTFVWNIFDSRGNNK